MISFPICCSSSWPWTSGTLPSGDLPIRLRTDLDAVTAASNDYGNLVHEPPSAVLYPSSVQEIVDLIKLSNNCSTPFTVAARGRGHSVRGQAMAGGGVVVEMAALSRNGGGIRVSWSPSLGYYADVGGEEIWADVLRVGLEHGLAPVSWTDYLYLTVGGTLSNAGISGQSFLHGPQISNVLELDVITGKGDFLTCSKDINSELFFAVLGGLGQFGIITRARIVLQKAPTRAKWMRLIYNDFTMFTRDQEHLISTNINGPNYVEGSLITDQSPPNNWRSSFYSPSDQAKILSLLRAKQGLLYSIEVVKYYDNTNIDTIDQEVELLVKDLNFIPGFVFKKDVSFVDFLTRVGRGREKEEENSDRQLEMETHPWLNLFLPKSRIMDFNDAVFVNIILRHNHSSGPILFYPFHRQKWDDRMSAVTPDEDIFYTLGLLHSSRPHQSDVYDKLNSEILEWCEKADMDIKQYLPHYKSKEDWMKHFGRKWDTFQEMKTKFDPRMILSPAQRIFTSVMDYGDM
ncbi:UNVERIFIED_CONTAM: Cytokinin dehydrogenase 3 [Sesamum calycinum]|uniref:cytokinin dehydrogenase n=1 Tax=Sesamum calycinum TaxID=2727403 RepID=A0AAW2N179_9LAMI